MTLETKRLHIRDLNQEDAKNLAELWADPVVTLYSGGPRDYKMVFDLVSEESKSSGSKKLDRWIITDKSTKEFLGECGFQLEKEVLRNGKIKKIFAV